MTESELVLAAIRLLREESDSPGYFPGGVTDTTVHKRNWLGFRYRCQACGAKARVHRPTAVLHARCEPVWLGPANLCVKWQKIWACDNDHVVVRTAYFYDDIYFVERGVVDVSHFI